MDSAVDSSPRGLSTLIRGPVLFSSDPAYDRARRVWNGMIDRRPLAIVCAASSHDVAETVRFARQNDLPLCVRGGGHSISGKCIADGALMIDLSLLKNVEVNSAQRRAVAQAGLTWGEFDRATEDYHLAVTGGVISSTGIAGLTLGGGMGWLMGKHGLTCDNLISADLVNAEGKHLRASAQENAELFWAIRGGGGNFGIVTAFEYQLHPLPSVYGGMILYPRSSAVNLLKRYRDVTAVASGELTAYAALMTGNGASLAGLALCHSGENAAAEREVDPLRLAGSSLADFLGTKRYTEVQSMLDFAAPPGLHYYFKCPFLRELSDEAIRAIVDLAESAPTEQTQVVVEHMHGAASKIAPDATAFALRRDHYSINIMPAWSDSGMTESCIHWARRFAAEMEAFGASDSYVNYLGDEPLAAVRASYGVNYSRLARLKAKYDPHNVFRFNQNIVASAAA